MWWINHNLMDVLWRPHLRTEYCMIIRFLLLKISISVFIDKICVQLKNTCMSKLYFWHFKKEYEQNLDCCLIIPHRLGYLGIWCIGELVLHQDSRCPFVMLEESDLPWMAWELWWLLAGRTMSSKLKGWESGSLKALYDPFLIQKAVMQL